MSFSPAVDSSRGSYARFGGDEVSCVDWGSDAGLIEDGVDKHCLAPGDDDESSEIGMTYLILFLLGVKLVLVFNNPKARKLKATVPKNIRFSTVWKIAMIVSSFGCLLSCGVANEEYKVSCTG